MMPGMNGEDLYLNIRKNKKFTVVPFIIITANIDDEVKLRQLEHGVNDYIMKPFQIKELILKVNNVLELRKNIEKNFGIDPFSKVTIKLSEKDFLTSLNEALLRDIKVRPNLDELSKNLFISKSTLDKRIRKLTNKNISQYIREFKIQYAMKLIDLGERNIQFLVDQTGFGSFSYFSTSFKSYLNISPRDYIKSVQSSQIEE
jgi:YesN/AraC family two-component response regulator